MSNGVNKLLRGTFMMLIGAFVLLHGTFTIHATEVLDSVEAVVDVPVTDLSADVNNTDLYYDGGTYKGLTWAVYNKATTLRITGTGVMSEDGEKMMADSYPWYKYSSTITTIEIGDEVTNVGMCAFRGMTSLQNVKLGDGITEIKQTSFFGCTSLNSIEIPSSVKEIEMHSFRGCSKLETLIFEEKSQLEYIGGYAFERCAALKEVILPDGVATIGEFCFNGCWRLKMLTLGSKLETIERCAFAYCPITAVDLPDSIRTIGDQAFCDSDIQSIDFPYGLQTIGYYAFGNSEIQGNVVIPDTVASLGEGAFSGSPNIKKVEIYASCDIGENMFNDCQGLEEVIIGDKVTGIDSLAFAYCESLTTVTMGSNVREIGADVFKDSPITKFTNYSGNTVYSDNSVYSNNSNFTMYGWAGSTTNTYADSNGITFVPLSLKTTTVSKLTTEASGVHVYWKEVPYAKTYDVYRSTTKTSGYSLIKSGVTSTNYLDTTVKSGTTYYYKVVAVRDSVKSELSAATDGITYIAAPTFKKIVNVVSGVHVYWNASTGAKTYSVYRSTSKDSGYTLVKSGLTAAHYIDTTAKSGTTYYYKIIALNGSVKSAYSKPFNAITYVGTPDITSRFNKGAGVQLGWNKIAGATGYAIYRKPYDGNTWTRVTTIEGNKTFTWMDESVKTNNGTVYKYTIRALAGSDMKTLSGCRNTGRTMARLTSRTLNSATKASATSIKCNWSTTAVCNGYEVRFMVGDTVYKTFTVGNYKTGVKTFTGLKAGQTYKIQVRSYKKVDGVGTFYSAWSTAKTVRL